MGHRDGLVHDLGTYGEQDEETKYSFGIRQYVLYKEFGIKKYFWYDLKSDGVNSRDYQDNFGTILVPYRQGTYSVFRENVLYCFCKYE